MDQHLDGLSVAPVVLSQPANTRMNGIPVPVEVLPGDPGRECARVAADVSAQPVNDRPRHVVVASTPPQVRRSEPEDSASPPAIVRLVRKPQRNRHRPVGLTTPFGKPLDREDARQGKEPARRWNPVRPTAVPQRPFRRT